MKIYNRLVISMTTGEVLEEDSFEYAGPVISARGEQKKALDQTEYEAQQEKLRADALRDAAWQQHQDERAQLLSTYQSLWDNPIGSDERGAAESAAAGPFEAAKTSAEHRAAATGNIAGMNETEDQLARSQAEALSQTEAQLADTAYKRKAAAVQGLSGLYGVDAGTLGQAMGLPAQYLDIYGRAAGTPRQPGFWDTLGDSFASSLGHSLGSFGFAPNGAWKVGSSS
jgi:hypothetical protein